MNFGARAATLPGHSSRLAWALLASLLIHLALIGDVAHWWPSFMPTGEMLPLEVRFATASAEVAPSRGRAMPHAQPAVLSDELPEERAATPSPILERITPLDRAEEAQERNLTGSQEAPPPSLQPKQNSDRISQSLPPSGKLVYKFYWGQSRWLAGQAVHQWVIENGRYTLSSTVSTTGLIGLFHPIKLVETSRGIIVEERLRPLEFTTQWNENPPAVAVFDWDAGYFRWTRGKASFSQPLSANSFDKISYLYQLYIAAEKENFFSPDITMGRRLEHYLIENLGTEELEIDGNIQPAIHLKRTTSSPDMEHVDIWLSTTSNNLPVKMTYSNKSGDYFEQLISSDSIPDKYPGR